MFTRAYSTRTSRTSRADDRAVFDHGDVTYAFVTHARRDVDHPLVRIRDHHVLGHHIGDPHLAGVGALRKRAHDITLGHDHRAPVRAADDGNAHTHLPEHGSHRPQRQLLVDRDDANAHHPSNRFPRLGHDATS
jgi:hypothetical protein